MTVNLTLFRPTKITFCVSKQLWINDEKHVAAFSIELSIKI